MKSLTTKLTSMLYYYYYYYEIIDAQVNFKGKLPVSLLLVSIPFRQIVILSKNRIRDEIFKK